MDLDKPVKNGGPDWDMLAVVAMLCVTVIAVVWLLAR